MACQNNVLNMEDIKKTLEWYQKMGVDEVISEKPGQLSIAVKSVTEKSNFIHYSDLSLQARAIADSCGSLSELREAIEKFEGLSIKKTANNTVFSDGNSNAEVMAIGEAPGANEDEEGIPFCGMSGRLLDQILASINLSRQNNLYITNSIFWRPPGNRKPTTEENEVCLPFVEKHIALIKPKLIILVGSTAASALLNSTETISRLRTQFYQYNNRYLTQSIPTAVIFHPSYLLRQPLQKKTVWYDLLKIKKTFLEK